jgi:AraC-like DNA-binding protein
MYTLSEDAAIGTGRPILEAALQVEALPACGECRPPTLATRRLAVERAIRMMRERYPDPLSLDDMARAAFFSRYHFNRMFRHLTGLPPGRFLAAIRLEAAKRLLLTTRFSITAVCFEVGYASVGTFTSHFTEYVGIPPHLLRGVSREMLGRVLALARSHRTGGAEEAGACRAATLHLSAPADSTGPVFVGLFATPVPRGRPLACVVAEGPGDVSLPLREEGCWAFAVRIPVCDDPATALLCESAPRGRAGPLGPGRAAAVELALRPPELMDPPVLVALPFLLADRLEEGHAPVPAPLVA